ncbi:MAG: hypothetical protein J6562_08060 [Candidatus Schmidhempelia sp.]|nr:hypothetical protein [Candidatus Schmidhempelia sp.]
MFNSILVVCVGNICRSPIGERLFKKIYNNKRITSAGLAALVDKPADPKSVEVAKKYGLSLEGHKAQQLTKELCLNHDLILVMENRHVEGVCHIAPEVRGKVMLFGHWLNRQEIPDPYRQDKQAFEHAYSLLQQSSVLWSKKL